VLEVIPAYFFQVVVSLGPILMFTYSFFFYFPIFIIFFFCFLSWYGTK